MATLAPDPQEMTPLEVRIQYLHRRRRAPRNAITVAVVVVAILWIAMIGLGLFLR